MIQLELISNKTIEGLEGGRKDYLCLSGDTLLFTNEPVGEDPVELCDIPDDKWDDAIAKFQKNIADMNAMDPNDKGRGMQMAMSIMMLAETE